MSTSSLLRDGIPLVLASSASAAAVVTWLSLLFALRRTTWRAVALAAFVVPAPLVAWRAGFRKRAVALAVLIATYALVRILFG